MTFGVCAVIAQFLKYPIPIGIHYMTAQRTLLARAWFGFWRTLDLTRKIILNVIFFGLLYLFFLAIKPEAPQRVNVDTTLVLRPYGFIVEQYSGSPVDRLLQEATNQLPEETRLRDLLTAIDRAAADGHIKQMVIDTDFMWGAGMASLLELEQAIARFKQSGKAVIATAGMLGQQQYYLAALADEIWLDPEGLVWIDGFSNYRNFYREGLEKLEVEVNLFRVGEYKSAMEPFIRDDMSDEAKEAARYWIGGLWQQYLEGISRQRGIPLEILNEAISSLPDRIEAARGDWAELALELGLVDSLVTAPEARRELARRGTPNREGDSYRAVDVETYLQTTEFMVRRRPVDGHIAVVVAEGEIMSGNQSPGRVGSWSVSNQLREAGRNSEYDAVVLRINSPGGEAFASEVIRREIQALRDQGKTVVVSMGDVAASGGYWIAMGSDEVWASPATVTGSIGVFGMIPTFARTLDKIGVHTDGVGTTPLAGKLRLDLPLDPDLRRIFQASTENVYEEFIALVSGARPLTEPEVREVAQGRVWSGAQAAERGLVDRIGTLQDALDAAARRVGLSESYRVTYIEPELSPFESLILDLSGNALQALNLKFSDHDLLPERLRKDLLADLRALLRSDGQLTVAAHCLCGIR
jgi:protease-4